MMNKRKAQNLQLYLHIPFCVKKCAYCDFLSGPASETEIEDYVQALLCEIRTYRDDYVDYEVSTIFLGGGTPSILTEEQIEGVFSALQDCFHICQDAEVTIEMNPGTVTREKLKAYQKVGINRLSIGLQSTNDEELRLLGRIHTMQEFLQTFQMARETGFHNINVDLISAIPGQTPESWMQTLRTVSDLEPEHISAYSLIVEEGTPFYEIYGENRTSKSESFYTKYRRLPSENDERKIYKETLSFLKSVKYHRYEISNYAKNGYECRHNLGYWKRENYLGIGLGASSLIENQRFHHIENRDAYITFVKQNRWDDVIDEREKLTKQAQMEEFLFLGLRMTDGISKEDFKETFDTEIEEVYGKVLKKLQEQKLIEETNNQIRLTDYGIDISNYVLSQFLLS